MLWSHVIAALCGALPALDHDALAALAVSAPVREVVLPRLVNALAEAGEVALVLDDLHRLSDVSAVAWFAAHLPAGVRLVLASRTDPALPLGTLRARGQLLELRTDALRFTAEEAEAFLNGRLGLGLSAADVDLLVGRTEGWPAGLYLAALSLAGAEDRHARVAAFDGTSAHVVAYLATEVLAAHPPGVQRFMLRTAVLERLCGPLCDAVLETRGSAAELESLARTNLFLLPLDDQRRWYPLAPPLRAAPAGGARAARAGARARAARARRGLAPGVRHDRRGDPSRRGRRRVRGRRRADRRNLGPLRERGADRVRARLARAHPGRRRRCGRPVAARRRVGLGAARP